MGRSTVGKALAALERDGRVRRTPGGHDDGRRRPDRWTKPASGDEQADAPWLRRGQLRTLVLQHLQQHPAVEHTPTGGRVLQYFDEHLEGKERELYDAIRASAPTS